MELGEGPRDAACSEVDVSKPCMRRISVLVGKAYHAGEIKSGFTFTLAGAWGRVAAEFWNFVGDLGDLLGSASGSSDGVRRFYS